MINHVLDKKTKWREESKSDGWQELHLRKWNLAGFLEAPPTHPVAESITQEWPMPERELGCLSYLCYVFPPRQNEVVVSDLSQSIHRLPYGSEVAPCITPGAKLLMLDFRDFENVHDGEPIHSRLI